MRKLRAKFTFLPLLWVLFLSPVTAPADGASEPEFLILVTNDDGFFAPGLRAMAEALAPLGEMVVAAPMENQSGTGHSTTSRQYIRVREVEIAPGISGYAVAARPATCVQLALEALTPRQPDLVVSGINRGMNLGVVVNYSGTVGAAREAAFKRIPSVAVSMGGNNAKDYAATAAFMRLLIERLRTENRLQPGLFLNVNAPAGKHRGVRITRQSTAPTPRYFDRHTNRRDAVYYWSDYGHLETAEEGSDVSAVRQGYISITPMQIDQTASAGQDWLEKLALEPGPVAVH